MQRWIIRKDITFKKLVVCGNEWVNKQFYRFCSHRVCGCIQIKEAQDETHCCGRVWENFKAESAYQVIITQRVNKYFTSILLDFP